MIGPVLPSAGAPRPLGVDAVRLRGGFWGERQERNAEATTPHVHRWLEETGRLGDFHLWANRGPASMRVWLPVTSQAE
ncbi:hypothetical protein ACTMTJ_18585 [Phytohabitans sp. LJ34]|uniref:hypothetical protein n=1 Tax=Phytohabitans sp. LJ34 TaxID=3452217 RepID=UPI003F8AD010